MATFDASQQAFETAKETFRKRLRNESLFKEILEAPSIEQVWEAANKVQTKQHAEKRLRNLAKIKGFLDKMSGYDSVMNTFVQAKPDIMALIWGPIRLVLLWTANISKFADAIASAMMKIGDTLPQFLDAVKIFSDNAKLKDVLALFYKDILDFYAIAVEFFSLSRSQILFESIWPRQRDKIDVVASNIERHTSLLRNEVTLQHIREEHDARAKSLAHFDEETKMQELQKFQALKFSISPRNYDQKLDELLNRSCNDSTKWLMRDTSFVEWLDMGNSATRTLWLQGIPGAGKTFLAAAAVEDAKARHRTLFVFASHVDSASTTARSILQSLVFQLAFDSEDVRSFLVQSKERDLSSSTAYVARQLRTLLGIVGPTYIVLDGLDEIDKVERGFLLQHLLDMLDCSDTKILISSRTEDDITNLLKTIAVAIRVDKRNRGSILSYIDQRAQHWMEERGFRSKSRQQIRHLLAPLAVNANGMFLYARIVMDNAELFTDLDEIKQELEVLPVDLNDAYHRIFKRINESHPTLRKKARAILGWIGCAPTPMTQREMEQALLVTSGGTAAPSVISDLNMVSICGPIVEVVDEIPQFVHFTVKEYVLGNQIEDFIDKAEADYSLAKSSLTYLCSGIFDINQSDKTLSKNMVTGKYRLHSYVTSQWIELTRRCIEHSKDLAAYPDLLELLTRFALELRNYNFRNQVNVKDPIFEGVTGELLEISEIVRGVLQFRQDERQTSWNYSNGSSWLNEDPTTLSALSIRLHETMELVRCTEGTKHRESCHCEAMQIHYGPNLFKCTFPCCPFNRHGFSTRGAWSAHEKHHDRPWKCSVASCPYAIMGFMTRQAQNKHWRDVHFVSQPVEGVAETPDQLTREDLQILIFELTKAGDVDRLQQTMLAVKYYKVYVLTSEARYLAAKMGSLPMVEILFMENDDWLERWGVAGPFYRAVIASEAPDLLRWLLDRLSSAERAQDFYVLAYEAFASGSPEMYAEWEAFLLDPSRPLAGADKYYRDGGAESDADGDFHEAKKRIPQYNKRHPLFSNSAFASARKGPVFETRLVQTWHRLIEVVGPLDVRFLGWSLTCLARSSNPSISLATELLRLGAPIDFPCGGYDVSNSWRARNGGTAKAHSRGHSPNHQPPPQVAGTRRRRRQTRHRGMTALHLVSRGTSEKAALLSRFLLEQGAEPEYGYAGVKPAQERGAALMKKWLGESWGDVVERTAHVRAEKRAAQGSGQSSDYEDESDGKEEDRRAGRSSKMAKRIKVGISDNETDLELDE